jgi:hypothetical protein
MYELWEMVILSEGEAPTPLIKIAEGNLDEINQENEKQTSKGLVTKIIKKEK